MREDRDCAISPPDVSFDKENGCDHIMEILHHLGRLAAKAGDKALAHDIEGLRARRARRKRRRMN